MGSCKSSKPSLPEIPRIECKLNLKDNMRFDFAYHYTLGTHLNHMFFLQTYLFGVFLCVGASIQCVSTIISPTLGSIYAPLISVVVIYIVYAALIVVLAMSIHPVVGTIQSEPNRNESRFSICIVRGLIVAYAVVVGVLAVLAVLTTQIPNLKAWILALAGLGVILASFCFQLMGHFWFERFIAKPDPWHGFIAAPILCWVSFLFKVKLLPELAEVWEDVTKIREKHSAKAM